MSSSRSTRSCEDPDVDFPLFDPLTWAGSGHLPIKSEVIGAMRNTVNKKVSSKQASWNIAGIIEKHWIQRNVYTIAINNI